MAENDFNNMSWEIGQSLMQTARESASFFRITLGGFYNLDKIGIILAPFY